MDVQTATVVLAGFSVIIATINSIISSRRAEQQRQVELFQQIYARWQDPIYLRAAQQIRHMQFANYDEYRQKYALESPQMPSIIVGTYYWGIVTLVNKGYIDIDLVDRLMGHEIILYWEQVTRARSLKS